MLTTEALARLEDLWGQPLGALVPTDVLARLADKGGAGRAVEAVLGIDPGHRLLDFDDGELKTYRADRDGNPRETVCIHQLGDDFDDLLRGARFARTRLYRKIRNVVLVGVDKEDQDPADWRVVLVHHLRLPPEGYWTFHLERSFVDVREELRRRMERREVFTTVSSDYLQLRVKDGRPYRPLFSRHLGRHVSNKQVGWYFTRRLLRELIAERQ